MPASCSTWRRTEAVPELNLEAAQKMAGSAIEHARQNNWRIAVAVLDAGGYPLQVSRMDGCNFLSPDIARGKAYAAAAWKLPSAAGRALAAAGHRGRGHGWHQRQPHRAGARCAAYIRRQPRRGRHWRQWCEVGRG